MSCWKGQLPIFYTKTLSKTLDLFLSNDITDTVFGYIFTGSENETYELFLTNDIRFIKLSSKIHKTMNVKISPNFISRIHNFSPETREYLLLYDFYTGCRFTYHHKTILENLCKDDSGTVFYFIAESFFMNINFIIFLDKSCEYNNFDVFKTILRKNLLLVPTSFRIACKYDNLELFKFLESEHPVPRECWGFSKKNNSFQILNYLNKNRITSMDNGCFEFWKY